MSGTSEDQRNKVGTTKQPPVTPSLSSTIPLSAPEKARAFDPLPRPRDLYTRSNEITTAMAEIRDLYTKLQDVERVLPSNIVQEIREQIGIHWMRIEDHDRLVNEDGNIKTILELRRENLRLQEKHDRMEMQLQDVIEGLRVAGTSLDNRDSDRRNAAWDKMRRSRPRAERLLSSETKTWRRQDTL